MHVTKSTLVYRLTGIVGTTGRGNPTQPSATNAQKNITGMEKRFLKSKVIQLGYMASTNHYHHDSPVKAKYEWVHIFVRN